MTKKTKDIIEKIKQESINVTRFSSIPYCSNSEFWPQTHVQNGNIHSKILDVYIERQSAHKHMKSWK